MPATSADALRAGRKPSSSTTAYPSAQLQQLLQTFMSDVVAATNLPWGPQPGRDWSTRVTPAHPRASGSAGHRGTTRHRPELPSVFALMYSRTQAAVEAAASSHDVCKDSGAYWSPPSPRQVRWIGAQLGQHRFGLGHWVRRLRRPCAVGACPHAKPLSRGATPYVPSRPRAPRAAGGGGSAFPPARPGAPPAAPAAHRSAAADAPPAEPLP